MQCLIASTLRPSISALGHKRIFRQVETISVLPPKADFVTRWHVRFVPIADMAAIIRSLRRRVRRVYWVW